MDYAGTSADWLDDHKPDPQRERDGKTYCLICRLQCIRGPKGNEWIHTPTYTYSHGQKIPKR
jgi:hypothetical protein